MIGLFKRWVIEHYSRQRAERRERWHTDRYRRYFAAKIERRRALMNAGASWGELQRAWHEE